MSNKETDFDEILEKVNEVVSKQDSFDRLRYFIEIRRLYNLLSNIYKGGVVVVNSDVMMKIPVELMKKHFNLLVEQVVMMSGIATDMRKATKPKKTGLEEKKKSEQEESEGEAVEKEPYEFREQEISYVV